MTLSLTVDPAALPFVRAWIESVRARSEQQTTEHVVESVACAARAIAHYAASEWAEAKEEALASKLHVNAAIAHRNVVKQCDVALRGYHYDAARAGR